MNELLNLENTWNSLNQKLDRNWKLNLEIIRETNLNKARGKVRGLIWVISITLAHYLFAAVYFMYFTATNWSVSHIAATGILLTLWALGCVIACIHELKLIAEIDYAKPVAKVQKKLLHIQMVIIRSFRLAVWIVPFYFCFIIFFFRVISGVDIVANSDTTWLIANVIISFGLFLPFAIWAHRKLNPDNIDKKWMKNLLQGQGSQLSSAMALLKNIESFETAEKH